MIDWRQLIFLLALIQKLLIYLTNHIDVDDIEQARWEEIHVVRHTTILHSILVGGAVFSADSEFSICGGCFVL